MPPGAREAVDSLGLVRDGYPILIYLPAWDGYIPLLVRHRLNRGYEVFEYGPLPDCGSISGGVIPAGGIAEGCTFPYKELPEELRTDMFYYTDRTKLFHAHAYIRPMMLRVLLEVPQGSKIYSFHGRVPQALNRDFGWFRGYREVVFLPEMHIGWDFYNPTNMDLYTHARFIYGEYEIEPILDVDVLVKILMGRVPSHVVPLGGTVKFMEAERAVRLWGAIIVPKPPVWATEDQVRSLVAEVARR